jgi:hypothetical protein
MSYSQKQGVSWPVYPRPAPEALHASLGHPRPPSSIRQEGFDQPELLDLLRDGRLDGPVIEASLCEYCLCIKYVETLQADLMYHALPLCFRVWQDCLFSGQYEETAAALHSALFRRPDVIAETIGHDAARTIEDFAAESILSRISVEQTLRKKPGDLSAHRWMAFLASYGCIWGNVARILNEWRSVHFRGYAIAAVQYLSLFAYDDREQTIFPSHSSSEGGGAPYPWSCAGGYSDSPKWRKENVEHMKQFLTVVSIQEWARAAAEKVDEENERKIANLVYEDITLQPYRVESRVRDVLHHIDSGTAYSYWSDSFGMAPYV